VSVDWTGVADRLDDLAREESWSGQVVPRDGQRRALAAIAERLRRGQGALLLADEVGMGKTLIAAALIKAVKDVGGRSAVVIPPGLGSQWLGELRRLDQHDRTLLPLRSFWTFIKSYESSGSGQGGASSVVDRRLQREWPQESWADEKVVLISHNLANIRRTEYTTPWYEGLGHAAARVLDGRRAYTREEAERVCRAMAEDIIGCLGKRDQNALQAAFEHADEMEKTWLTMSRGLGRFDLIVIDEAHKARGVETSLTRVLNCLTWKASGVFRLGMTATPVELGTSQWTDTLRRLAVPQETLLALGQIIEEYENSVRRLQQGEALTKDSVERFRIVAEEFESKLSPWVLRRDKREDAFLRRFYDLHGSHREIRPAMVGFADMALDWKRAFLATEALSMMKEHRLSPSERRLRLSLPDGRGLGGLDEILEVEPEPASVSEPQQLWSSLARQILGRGHSALFSHPAIIRAVEEIETAVRDAHKVLVFGRYTKPIRALTFLLDAREMVRRLCGEDVVENRWPQSTLGVLDPEREGALTMALADPLVNTVGLDRSAVNEQLKARADIYATARKSNLEAMRAALQRRQAVDTDAAVLLSRWQAEGQDSSTGTNAVLLLAALEDQRPRVDRHQPWTEEALIGAYQSLVREIAAGSDDDDAKEEFEARLKDHLDVFSGREGNFARLMNGGTAAQTRRLLQAAFNREASWPQVLVAQSMVGREGLNLHGACRMVVMLHLEWNPAHVEQQIGRVDRIDSRWEREAHQFTEAAGGACVVPKILVRPIVVEGTYDDHHWAVLRQRWDSMRAQLNGDVLPNVDCDPSDTERNALIGAARAAAPDLAPPPIPSAIGTR